jgi:Werner syndrome ATP-dependent helicase
MTDKRLESYNAILQKHFQYPSLKTEQYKIISNVLDGKDVIAILATGFGKSICYQLPTMISKKCVIVISPLIALMHEQGEEMKIKNIPVCVFNSTKNKKEKEAMEYILLSGGYKLIYMTPEYLIKSETFLKKLVSNNNLAMICIDEAHAVSTWGLDFRVSYTKLNVIREWIPDIPILTLTATASTKVKDDITKMLGLQNPFEVTGNFDRPNLNIKVHPRSDDVILNIGSLLEKYKNEYIIIYCKTRDETDKLAETINNFGIECESYHAGITDKKRNDIQQNFIDGKFKCIIATIAFGMGINIPTVRLVIHYNCPKNMESYYQEIGRAGRDGLASECVLFYSKKDFYVNRLFLKTITDDTHRTYQESQIRLIEKYVYSSDCRRKLLLINFGQKIESCVNCDNCLKKINISEKETPTKMVDYTKQIYLFLNLITRIDNKFGSGMSVNILTGKNSKIKEYMSKFEEFGVGLSFGNENWWKELIRLLINEDYLIETQVKGSFGTTLSLTNKGKTLRKKLITQYPKYLDLLQAIVNFDNEAENNPKTIDQNNYFNFRLMYEPIKNNSVKKTTKTTKSTKSTKSIKSKSIKSTKPDPSETIDLDDVIDITDNTSMVSMSNQTNKTNQSVQTKSTGLEKNTHLTHSIKSTVDPVNDPNSTNKNILRKSVHSMDINNMPTTFLKYNIDNDSSLDDMENDLIELNKKEEEEKKETIKQKNISAIRKKINVI